MRRSSPSSHAQFFKSLKHLEKRLKLETDPSPLSRPVEPQDDINDTQQSDSLGTPIYLNYNQSAIDTNSSNLQESEVPQEFLSNPPDFQQTHHSTPRENQVETVDQPESDNDIEVLMQLLRLSDCKEVDEMNGVGCDDGFYGKIVGVKGPKSTKEIERLEGWIKYYLNGEKMEPLRLAHLLMAKAAFVHSNDDDDDDDNVGFGGFVFPSTIDEFLHNDPPIMD